MKLLELNQGTKKEFMSIVIRTSIIAFLTIAAIVCGILGSFYYHLLLQSSLSGLICFGACALSVVLGLVSLILKRKDDYKSFVACIMQFKGSASEAESKSVIEEFLNPKQGGYAGFKSAVRDNKILLSAMLTGCKAIPAYADHGILTVIYGFILRFAYTPFIYFALIDGLLTGGGKPNRVYRIMASTRWFPIRDRYSKAPVSYVISKIVPLILWIVLSAITSAILDGILGITSGMETIIWFGFLSLLLQLVGFGGNRSVMHRMAIEIYNKEENLIPAADYNLCMAFAQISQIYYQACVEAGFIQTTSTPIPSDADMLEGDTTQMLQ